MENNNTKEMTPERRLAAICCAYVKAHKDTIDEFVKRGEG